MKSSKELSEKLARQWQSADYREQRLLISEKWPIILTIGKANNSILQKSPKVVREHISSWRNVTLGRVQYEEYKYQSAATPIELPKQWVLSSPSEWIEACKSSKIEKEYQWLSGVLPNIDPIFHKLILRQSSLWKASKDNVIECAKLAMKLFPGIAEDKPIRSICVNNIDTKFIENNRNLLIKLLNIRFNNAIRDNDLEHFLGASYNNEHWVLLLPLDDKLLPFKQLRLTTSELKQVSLPGTHLLIVENEQCRYQLPERLEQTIVILGAGLDLKWLNNPSFKSKMLKNLITKKLWKIIIRDGLILLIILFLYGLYQTRNMPEITPELKAQLVSGELVDLKKMADKSPVLVYFWGSWCPMCSYTSTAVTKLSKDYPVLTIALSSGDDLEVEQYLLENGYKFPVINDADGIISNVWGVVATPTFFIINRQGKISFITTGISSLWGLKFRLWLAT